jgi:hypothetical protein
METTIDNKVSMVMRQTDYTEEEAQQKLLEYNDDAIKVIKHYLGITEKKALPKPAASLNQEIYKQLRSKLDESIKTYNLQQEEKLKEELTLSSPKNIG